MNTSVGFVALCLILCSGLVQSQNNLSQFCKNKGFSSGIYPHPYRCDEFIQCRLTGNVLNALVQRCPPGLLYDEALLTCNWASNVKCNKDCKSRPKIKDLYTCNGYYECANGQRSSALMKCSNGYMFDGRTFTCVVDSKCPPTPVHIVCSDRFRVAKDPSKFWQFGGSTWILKRCAPGTGFNISTCTCSNYVAIAHGDRCNLINLPMSTNLVELNNNWYIENKNVTVYQDAAQFNGNNRLIIPLLVNNAFQDHIKISLDFKLRSATQNEVAILTNGNCGNTPSIAIYVQNTLSGSPQVVGLLEIENVATPTVMLTGRIVVGEWTTLVLMKSGDTISMSVNSQSAGQRVVRGYIKTKDCALTIGQADNKANFIGQMKQLVIRKCA